MTWMGLKLSQAPMACVGSHQAGTALFALSALSPLSPRPALDTSPAPAPTVVSCCLPAPVSAAAAASGALASPGRLAVVVPVCPY